MLNSTLPLLAGAGTVVTHSHMWLAASGSLTVNKVINRLEEAVCFC